MSQITLELTLPTRDRIDAGRGPDGHDRRHDDQRELNELVAAIYEQQRELTELLSAVLGGQGATPPGVPARGCPREAS